MITKDKWRVAIGTKKQHKKCKGRIYITTSSEWKGKKDVCMCK